MISPEILHESSEFTTNMISPEILHESSEFTRKMISPEIQQDSFSWSLENLINLISFFVIANEIVNTAYVIFVQSDNFFLN